VPPAEEFIAAAAAGQRAAEVLAERRTTVPLPDPAKSAPAVQWKLNQTCWCCKIRRKCRPSYDPSWATILP
jgi:hypothetical protein